MIRSTTARLRGAAVALTTTAAMAGTVVGVAQPAQAANTCSTSTVVDEGGHTADHVMTWGDFEAVHVHVTARCTDGTTTWVSIGSTTLSASTDGGATWSTVASASNYDAAYIQVWGPNTVSRTTIYRATYTGGYDSKNVRSYTGSSDSLTIGLLRQVTTGSTCSGRGCRMRFHIAPAASISGGSATIQQRRGGTWHTYRRVLASSWGNVALFLPTGYYRMVLPGGRGFLHSRHGVYHT